VRPLAILYLAALVLATFAASVSGMCLLQSIEDDSRREAWAWAGFFVVSSVLATYYFFTLVEGRV
jgi:hypothetical protein